MSLVVLCLCAGAPSGVWSGSIRIRSHSVKILILFLFFARVRARLVPYESLRVPTQGP
jgi:hypothetical protein